MRKNIIIGIPVSEGVACGQLRIINSVQDLNKIVQGEIILVEKSNPIYVIAFPRISGIISEIGGTMSHLGIIAREMGIPSVFGVSNARKILRHGMKVTLNGSEGKIFYE